MRGKGRTSRGRGRAVDGASPPTVKSSSDGAFISTAATYEPSITVSLDALDIERDQDPFDRHRYLCCLR